MIRPTFSGDRGKIDEGFTDDVRLDGGYGTRHPAQTGKVVGKAGRAGCAQYAGLIYHHLGGGLGLLLTQAAGKRGAGSQVYPEMAPLSRRRAAAKPVLLAFGQVLSQVGSRHAEGINHRGLGIGAIGDGCGHHEAQGLAPLWGLEEPVEPLVFTRRGKPKRLPLPGLGVGIEGGLEHATPVGLHVQRG